MKDTHTLPEYRDILEILKKNEFLPGISIERQLVSHLRNLIHRKKLVPHTRIPPFRMLAGIWQTNYRTVQLAVSKLAAEGLFIRSPMKGTFVAPTRRPLKRVCLYLDSRHLIGVDAFYTQLTMMLFRELSRQGVVITTFFDYRPKNQLGLASPEVAEMVRHGDIDALITGTIFPSNTEWLLKLGIPSASLMFPAEERRIEVDFECFARLAMGEAQKINASSVGVIFPASKASLIRDPIAKHFYYEMDKAAAEKGIKLIKPIDGLSVSTTSWERRGHQIFENLLMMGPLPPVLVVYPDAIVPGLAHALLQHQIQVPKEVLLICHRNLEMPTNLPFPVTWLTVKISDFAQALIRQIKDQIAGKKLKATKIGIVVERPATQ